MFSRENVKKTDFIHHRKPTMILLEMMTKIMREFIKSFYLFS